MIPGRHCCVLSVYGVEDFWQGEVINVCLLTLLSVLQCVAVRVAVCCSQPAPWRDHTTSFYVAPQNIHVYMYIDVLESQLCKSHKCRHRHRHIQALLRAISVWCCGLLTNYLFSTVGSVQDSKKKKWHRLKYSHRHTRRQRTATATLTATATASATDTDTAA